MTGPNRSPSGPWARDSLSYHAAGSPNATPVLPLRGSPLNDDSHPQNIGPGRSSPGYCGISSMKQGFSKDWNARSHIQSSVTSPKALSRNASFGDYMDLTRQSPEFDREAFQVQRSESARPCGSVPSRSPSKSLSCHPGEPDRCHKMSVCWEEGQAGQAHENTAVSKSSGALSSPTVYPTSSAIVPQASRHAPASNLADRCGTMISPVRCAELLKSSEGIMLLDVRPYTHFAQATIEGSLNLCIPTTLLKRSSFDTRKLEGTFTDETERGNFARWKRCHRIIVYDASTTDIKDAAPLLNVLTKFTVEGWTGEGLVLSGGFNAFQNSFPNMVQLRKPEKPELSNQMGSGLSSVAPVVGGCRLPESSTAAVPFFNNIRQNTDLRGGVGQMTIRLPERLTESRSELLPGWLRAASDPEDEGRQVSMKFLDLERRELERMREALSYDTTAESIVSGQSTRFRIAGIEKGAKNRYNDIYPFDHSRVRLQDVPAGGCDYVNASHIRTRQAGKSYIATQAPVPATFNDFWRVVWEQGVKVLVSLTAEIERGQVKCHPYWNTGDYGPLRVRNFSERYIRLHLDARHAPGIQRSPRDVGVDQQPSNECDDPYIIVRHLSLSHAAFPFQPLREITQLQYPYWPDFGTPVHPSHLVELIEQCNWAVGASNASTRSQGVAPMLVHCSAGCGRTGTFCTVDSVLDAMKRGQVAGSEPHEETLDPIAQTVDDLRTQRPSMVQNLSQFVLCYETVLEWMASQMADLANN